MRYVVVGAGAIGGGVGGLLQLAGIPTTLVARGGHLDALRATGMQLSIGGDQQVVPVLAVGTPAEVTWTEDTVVLLAVKSQQTRAAVATSWLRCLRPPRSSPCRTASPTSAPCCGTSSTCTPCAS